MAHSLSHIIPRVGPHVAHINWFGKGDFVDSVSEGNTYTFENIRVEKDKYDDNELHINTAKFGTTIVPATPLTEVLAITAKAPMEYITSTFDGEILGIENVSSYLSCSKCPKKIEIVTQSTIIECRNCHLKQKQSSCSTNWYVQLLFLNTNNSNLSLTIFDDVLEDLFSLNGQNIHKINLSKDVIEEAILKLPTVITVTFQKRNKVIKSITKCSST